MEALEAYCQLCYHQEFIVKKSRILSESQIKSLFTRHKAGITEFNRLKGSSVTTNTEPAIKLSMLRAGTNSETDLFISDKNLEVLANLISEKVIEKINLKQKTN